MLMVTNALKMFNGEFDRSQQTFLIFNLILPVIHFIKFNIYFYFIILK